MLFASVRTLFATRLARMDTPASLRVAARLEPGNATHENMLGRYYLLGREQDVSAAIRHFQRAVALDAYSPYYWLDLAIAYQVAERATDMEWALRRARAADPNTPDVAWKLANLQLASGQIDSALDELGTVALHDEAARQRTMTLCWSATHDVSRILRFMPADPDVYTSLLMVLIEEKQLPAARIAWNRLIGLDRTFVPQNVFPYFTFLIAEKAVSDLDPAWRQLASIAPSLEPYLPADDNLVINGGFENRILDGGLDWRYIGMQNVSMWFDTQQVHGGARAMVIRFEGPTADAGIFQYIPVKPGAEYNLSAAYRSEELRSPSPPRLTLVDAYSGQPIFSGEEMIGSAPWRITSGRVRIPAETSLVILKILRAKGETSIDGTLWLDDVQLRQTS